MSEAVTNMTEFAIFMFNMMQQWANIIISAPWFPTYGLAFLFLYAQTPSIIVIPNEVFTLPLYLAGISPIVLGIVLAVAGFLGDVWLYLIGLHSSNLARKILKGREKQVADAEHKMHEHRWIFMLPAIPVFPNFVSDIVMLLAGHQHLDFKKIAPIIFLAESIKAVFIVLAVMGIIAFFSFLT